MLDRSGDATGVAVGRDGEGHTLSTPRSSPFLFSSFPLLKNQFNSIFHFLSLSVFVT